MATGAVEATNRTISRAAASAAERFGDRTAIRRKQDDEWHDTSFAEVGQIVDELALGLTELGLEPGDRTAILANTRPEWTYSSLAISRAGGIVVPIYPTNSPDECEWVLGNSDAKIVICEDQGQAEKIEQIRERLEHLEHVVLIDKGDGDGTNPAIDELRDRARDGDRDELERRCDAVSPRTPTRSSTRRARPAHPRASSSATATAPRLG